MSEEFTAPVAETVVETPAPAPQNAEPMTETVTAPEVNPVEPVSIQPPVSLDTPAPSKPEKLEDPGTELAEKLRLELEEVSKERIRLQKLTDRHLDSERLNYLREIGAKDGMTDKDLLLLAPSADVTTPEGRAAMDDFREQSGVYFDHRVMTKPAQLEEMVTGFKESEYGTFTQKNALKILKKMTGSKP